MKWNQVRLALAIVAAFLLGCLVGGAIVFVRTVPPTVALVALGDRARAGENAYVRYRYGTYPVGKEALLGYARKVQESSGDLFGPKTADFELGLTYGRLALLAERSHQAADAAEYMRRAMEAFGRRDQKVDESSVRKAVERLDAAWDQRLTGTSR